MRDSPAVLRTPRLLFVLVLVAGCPTPPPQADDESSSAADPGQDESATLTSGGSATSTTAAGPTTSGTGDPSPSTSDDSAPSSDASSSGEDLAPRPPTCADLSLGDAIGQNLAELELTGAPSRLDSTCGDADASERIAHWIAPSTDYYIFHTTSSEFDTLLYLTDSDCDAPTELACNDNAPGEVTSRIIHPLEVGQDVLVVVEGRSEQGTATLHIEPVLCPAGDVSDIALPANFSNEGVSNVLATPCGGSEGRERTFRFTAQESGLYRFGALSSDFAPVIAVEDGPICGSPLLQCNAAAPDLEAQVVRQLDAGQSLTLIVDSLGEAEAGPFTLDVQRIADTCSATPIGSEGSFAVEFAGSLEGAPLTLTTSCSPPGEVIGGQAELFPSKAYLWTSPEPVGTSTSCNIIYEGGFPAALSLQEGACAGPETQCIDATAVTSETEPLHYTASLRISDIPSTLFTIVVARSAGDLVAAVNLEYRLMIECMAIG